VPARISTFSKSFQDIGFIHKALSEHNGALCAKYRLKYNEYANRDTRLKEIDSYGINKPDVKGIVRFLKPCIQQPVSGG
jgi:hypothetical protein